MSFNYKDIAEIREIIQACERISGLKLFNDYRFFCMCKECGSLDWDELNKVFYENRNIYSIDNKWTSNELTEKGECLLPNDLLSNVECVCHNCEAPTKRIPVKYVDLDVRIKLNKMSDEERLGFAESWELLEKIEGI